MPTVDLVFPARGEAVPLDHGYLLFSALSARIPELHERRDVGVFNLRGQGAMGELLQLGRGSLRIRCPVESIPVFLKLAGGGLTLAGQHVTLGAPTIRAMEPVSQLSARLVTFKHALEEATFRAAAHRFLEELTGMSGTLHVGRRRIVTIAQSKVVGFGLDVSGLSPEAALVLQEKGLGGRRHMGCGLFLPQRQERAREVAHGRATA